MIEQKVRQNSTEYRERINQYSSLSNDELRRRAPEILKFAGEASTFLPRSIHTSLFLELYDKIDGVVNQ